MTCTFAAVSITESTTPSRSETRWRFEPDFPLSVGFALVLLPPFGRNACRVKQGTFPIYSVGLSESVQKDFVQTLPYSAFVPLAQAS
jgi:hypothetical protein